MTLNIGVVGAFGRMGIEVLASIQLDADVSLGCCYGRHCNTDAKVANSLKTLVNMCDVIIDFSSPELLKKLISTLKKVPKPLVSGTTGHNYFEMLKDLAQSTAVLWSANMSLGINLILNFLQQYSKSLEGFDISISEAHHSGKKDTPSGTAILMQSKIGESLPNKNIKISSLREGEIFGQHSILFAREQEIIELVHTALNRRLFADGAIFAAKKICHMKNGLYSMQDLLK